MPGGFSLLTTQSGEYIIKTILAVYVKKYETAKNVANIVFFTDHNTSAGETNFSFRYPEEFSKYTIESE